MHIGLNIKKKNYSCKSYNFFFIIIILQFLSLPLKTKGIQILWKAQYNYWDIDHGLSKWRISKEEREKKINFK